METLIKSDVFDRGDSTYLIDIVRSGEGAEFIRLRRTIHSGAQQGVRIIQFDQYVLERISALVKSQAPEVTFSVTGKPTSNPRLRRVSLQDRSKIVEAYLKNVSTWDLAVRFNCKAADIEEVLREEGIVVVLQKPPTSPGWRKTWRRRK
jgi:hypothetical protein